MTSSSKNKFVRIGIINKYALWTALSSTRSGSPLKSRKDIYCLLEKISFNEVLNGRKKILESEFDRWHKENTNRLKKKLPIGWAVKIINVYLKTSVYIGGLGRPGLIYCIHPPIDSALLEGLKEEYKDDFKKEIGNYKRIKDIVTYQDYLNIILGVRKLINGDYLLIEADQFWKGTDYDK